MRIATHVTPEPMTSMTNDGGTFIDRAPMLFVSNKTIAYARCFTYLSALLVTLAGALQAITLQCGCPT